MKRTLTVIAVAVAAAAAGGAWYLHAKQPLRNGSLAVAHLQAPVDVRYDERGVPHLYAQNQTDLYRALGYVHAQDRLFQMEMLRRLARGELAEVLGPKLVDTDRLFRTLRIRDHAAEYSARQDKQSQPWKVLEAYLDGVNQFQENNPAPLEFDLLGIPRRPFTPEDTLSIAGYMAYSFAAAFRTEPVLTYIRDELGSDYLRIFDLDWHPQGVLTPSGALGAGDWKDLGALARLSQQALEDAGLPQFEGSNAWVVAGSRTASGKPLLAGDPHIRFAAPAVWYEAQLSAPGFELYGHHQALNPFASLGHNRAFGWSLTMFQNDDLDLVAEKVNPDNPNQVWYQGEWVDLQSEEQEIAVKGAAPVKLTLRRSPHGPIVNDALGASSGKTPIAMWWAFLETENPVLDAFYQLNRADTLAKARAAASKIHSPGLNLVWANAAGDIGWWASAALPKRPEGEPELHPRRQQGRGGQVRLLSVRRQPTGGKPGARLHRLRQLPAGPGQWPADSRLLQPGGPRPVAGYPTGRPRHQMEPGQQPRAATRQSHRLRATPARTLAAGPARGGRRRRRQAPGRATGGLERRLPGRLDRRHAVQPVAVPDCRGRLARRTGRCLLRQPDRHPRHRQRAASAGWRRRLALVGRPPHRTPGNPRGYRQDRLERLPRASAQHPRQRPVRLAVGQGAYPDPRARPGPASAAQAPSQRRSVRRPRHPRGTEQSVGEDRPGPWAVTYGPSTRRLVDFADPTHSLGINPVGQSGVPFDGHYDDQAEAYIEGHYLPQHYEENEVKANSKGVLVLEPKR